MDNRIPPHRAIRPQSPVARPAAPGANPPPAPGSAPASPGAGGPSANRPASPDPAALRLERTYAMEDRKYEEMATHVPQSRPNGFKLMTPHLSEAISQSQALFPPNVHGIVSDPREHTLVFHEDPRTGKLVPVGRDTGDECKVKVPEDIRWPTARVLVHTHPYTGRHSHDYPSMTDQLVAREHPNVEHIVQAPAANPDKPNKYRIYTGAYPPRFHTLVENPLDLPASPHSSDGESTPPFKDHPFK